MRPHGLRKALISDPDTKHACGLIEYSTYLGGSGNDYGRAIAVHDDDRAYITGSTHSDDFPTWNGYYTTFGGNSLSDAFVTKLRSNGSISFSTYLAGAGSDSGNSIALDSSGDAYITGNTTSTNFPTTKDAYQTTYGGGVGSVSGDGADGGDAFVTRLSFAGTLEYSTYLGGSGDDHGRAIALSYLKDAYITGSTSISDAVPTSFPETGAHEIALSGSYVDAFLSRLSFDVTPSTYTATYRISGLTVHMAQSLSSTELTGTFSTGTIDGNLGGFVDSNGSAYAWAWYDDLISGSGVLAGSISSDGAFNFGGGQSSTGRIDETVLRGMTRSSLSGRTAITPSSGTADYSGTYTSTGLTITLTQDGSILSGTFDLGGFTGAMGGFVDSSDRAYVLAYWDSSSSGSGVVAGRLTLSGNQATFNFGGGRNSGGRIGAIILSDLARQ